MTHHTAFFGDGAKTFAFPTRDLIEELERKTGYGIGALFRRFRTSEYSFSEIIHVLRLGLIGGGMLPARADQLVAIYGIGRPMAETFAVADGVITALFFGNVPGNAEDDFGFPQDDQRQAAAIGDISAAINEALKQVAE
jgi:hypothetical protein